MSGVIVALGLAIASVGAADRPARAHPLHTTYAEVSIGASGEVEIRLRAFVDDFSAAVGGLREAPSPPFKAPSDSATARYLADNLTLTGATGRSVTLHLTSSRHDGDVIWVTLRATGVRSLAGARLTNTVLFERYHDQVNVVQTAGRDRRETLLFTRRDGRTPKLLAG